MRPRSHLRKAAQRVTTAALASVALASLLLLPLSAAEDPQVPGTPLPPPAFAGGFVEPRATALTEVARAQQALRMPPLYLYGRVAQEFRQEDRSCRRLFPYWDVTLYQALIHFISTNEGAPAPYGYIGPFTVRTVAFGSIPVEAEVLIAQPRDESDLPVPYELRQTIRTFCAGEGPHAGPGEEELDWDPIEAQMPVDLAITALAVDGVDLTLQTGCRPTERTAMTLRAPRYLNLDPDLEPEDLPRRQPGAPPWPEENRFTTPFFGFANGGRLTAEINIAPFTGCRTEAGEDVSALLTGTVSGPGNAVTVVSEGLEGESRPVCAVDLTLCAEPLRGLPYPEREGD